MKPQGPYAITEFPFNTPANYNHMTLQGVGSNT